MRHCLVLGRGVFILPVAWVSVHLMMIGPFFFLSFLLFNLSHSSFLPHSLPSVSFPSWSPHFLWIVRLVGALSL